MTTRKEIKGNVWRELLARAIEANGGYSSHPLSWNVAVHESLPTYDEAFKKVVGGSGDYVVDADTPLDPKLLAELKSEWEDDDEGRMWYSILEGMRQGLTDGDTYRTIRPEIAARYGLAGSQERFPRRYKRREGEVVSYQAAKEGWVVQDPWGHIPYFDVEWEFLGRQGKHLCLVSFEGRKLKDYSKWFAQSLREPPTAEEYSNEWCQKLVAFIHECDLMFEYKNIASEFEYLALFRFYCRIEEIEEQTKKMLKETAERQFWAERDVMTTKETP